MYLPLKKKNTVTFKKKTAALSGDFETCKSHKECGGKLKILYGRRLGRPREVKISGDAEGAAAAAAVVPGLAVAVLAVEVERGVHKTAVSASRSMTGR